MSKIDQIKVEDEELYDIKDRYTWSGTKAEWNALDKSTLPQDEEIIIYITDDIDESEVYNKLSELESRLNGVDTKLATVDTKLSQALYIVSFDSSTGTLTTKSADYTG